MELTYTLGVVYCCSLSLFSVCCAAIKQTNKRSLSRSLVLSCSCSAEAVGPSVAEPIDSALNRGLFCLVRELTSSKALVRDAVVACLQCIATRYVVVFADVSSPTPLRFSLSPSAAPLLFRSLPNRVSC